MKMGKGIVLVLSVLFLLLLTSYAIAQDCACNSCHGNPPVVSTIGGPNGLAMPSTGSTTPGAHAKHAVSSTGQNQSCYECHFGGMPVTSMCGNSKIQIGFDLFGLPGGGTKYDGQVLNFPFSYEGTTNTVVTTGGSKVCSNIYCHSDGTALATGVVPASSISPAWDSTAGQPACNSCHGYPPSYPQMTLTTASPKANEHVSHMTYAGNTKYGCGACHYTTTTAANTITNPENHANGKYDIVVAPDISYSGTHINFTYRREAGAVGGYCDNVTCHGGVPNTAYWGRTQPYIGGFSLEAGAGCYELKNFNVPSGNGVNLTFPLSYTWDFGNGDPKESGEASSLPILSTSSHFYPGTGPYNVTISGKDSFKREFSKTQLVYPKAAANVPAKTTSPFKSTLDRWTVVITDESYDPDYNQCGHSGNGRIIIDAGSDALTINGVTTTKVDEAIALTNQPSNKIYTVVYKSTVSGARTIYRYVQDNSSTGSWNIQDYKTHTISNISISGKVTTSGGSGLSGATLTLKDASTGGTLRTTTTAADGTYSFSWSTTAACVTVTPTKSGYTFTPSVSQSYCHDTANVNFTSSP